jgi:hypothetical protein
MLPLPKLEADGKRGRGRPKGVPKTGGRAQGTPNKITTLLKDSILLAAADAGGKEGLRGYLRQQAIANPVAYLQLLARVLPTQLAADTDIGPPVVIIRKFTYPDDDRAMKDVTPAPPQLK